MREKVDARKTRIGPSGLARVLDGAKAVLIAKGAKLERFDLSQRTLDRSELAAKMVGPTGNLRAPTLRRGGLVVVGFHPEALRELLQ